MKLEWTEPAVESLQAIKDYIVRDNVKLGSNLYYLLKCQIPPPQ